MKAEVQLPDVVSAPPNCMLQSNASHVYLGSGQALKHQEQLIGPGSPSHTYVAIGTE